MDHKCDREVRVPEQAAPEDILRCCVLVLILLRLMVVAGLMWLRCRREGEDEMDDHCCSILLRLDEVRCLLFECSWCGKGYGPFRNLAMVLLKVRLLRRLTFEMREIYLRHIVLLMVGLVL